MARGKMQSGGSLAERRKEIVLADDASGGDIWEQKKPGPGAAPTPGQGFQPRKLAISLSPARWLFSGWNWVPSMLSRPMIAVTSPP